jgi:hypothetical protein
LPPVQNCHFLMINKFQSISSVPYVIIYPANSELPLLPLCK